MGFLNRYSGRASGRTASRRKNQFRPAFHASGWEPMEDRVVLDATGLLLPGIGLHQIPFGTGPVSMALNQSTGTVSISPDFQVLPGNQVKITLVNHTNTAQVVSALSASRAALDNNGNPPAPSQSNVLQQVILQVKQDITVPANGSVQVVMKLANRKNDCTQIDIISGDFKDYGYVQVGKTFGQQPGLLGFVQNHALADAVYCHEDIVHYICGCGFDGGWGLWSWNNADHGNGWLPGLPGIGNGWFSGLPGMPS